MLRRNTCLMFSLGILAICQLAYCMESDKQEAPLLGNKGGQGGPNAWSKFTQGAGGMLAKTRQKLSSTGYKQVGAGDTGLFDEGEGFDNKVINSSSETAFSAKIKANSAKVKATTGKLAQDAKTKFEIVRGKLSDLPKKTQAGPGVGAKGYKKVGNLSLSSSSSESLGSESEDLGGSDDDDTLSESEDEMDDAEMGGDGDAEAQGHFSGKSGKKKSKSQLNDSGSRLSAVLSNKATYIVGVPAIVASVYFCLKYNQIKQRNRQNKHKRLEVARAE